MLKTYLMYICTYLCAYITPTYTTKNSSNIDKEDILCACVSLCITPHRHTFLIHQYLMLSINHICIHIYTYRYIYVCIYTHTHTHTHTHIYIHVYINRYIHIYTFIYIDRYTLRRTIWPRTRQEGGYGTSKLALMPDGGCSQRDV